MEYYLAIDIGASSGRHILGSLDGEKIILKEIYRFDNEMKRMGDNLYWDIERLENEVKNGIKECGNLGIAPKSIAIDTWGVDYVLLDGNKKPITPVFAYRDSRTDKMIEEVGKIISPEELYSRTGIQEMYFNTIYQLYSDKLSGRLENAEHYLMMPEYLSFCLTGEIRNEYTNATTTGLVNAKEKQWDKEIFKRLGYPEKIFSHLSLPGTVVGSLTKEVQEYVGFDSTVVLCPSHDTASAVLACPLQENGLYISSGTWSLMGMEILNPVLTEEARKLNFTNEGGINYRFRFLKNYMGMWLLQNIRKNLNKKYTYDEMMYMAMDCKDVTYIDVNAKELVSPDNMIEAVKVVAGKSDMTLEQVLCCVYHSLAKSYKNAVDEIEQISGEKVASINIVGGGSADKYLNRLTSEYTGKKVYAGPREATAMGNIISQIIRDKENFTIWDARDYVRVSFDIEEAK